MPNPEFIDQDNPEWTLEDISRARPARDMLLELFGSELAQEMLKFSSRTFVPIRNDIAEK